jgi:hypothetical protein
MKSSYTLSGNHFTEFVAEVNEKFMNCNKQAINGFIGMLGRSVQKSTQHYFETDYDVMSEELVLNARSARSSVHVRGIYPDDEDLTDDRNILNATTNELERIIEENSTINPPMVYQISFNNEIPLYENTLPIHRKIYDIARMEMYELYMEVKELNPKCVLVGIKTDCLVFNRVKIDPPLSKEWGGVKKCNVPLIKECTIDNTKEICTDPYVIQGNEWNNFTWCEGETYTNDEGMTMDAKIASGRYINDGFLMLGMAGSGKSEILKEAQRILEKNTAVRSFLTACPTHKACKIVNGTTIHRLFNINPIDFSYEYGKAHEIKQAGIKYIFLDEVSMISEQLWNVLAHIKTNFGFVFCGFGDFQQLKPVNEEHIDFKNTWIVKYVFNNNLCELTHIHRFDDNVLLQDAHKCARGEAIDFKNYTTEEHDLCLCWTNAAVDALNKKWNTHYAKQHDKTLEVDGFRQSKYILHEGLKLMAYRSGRGMYYNSEEFTVKSFDDDSITLHPGENSPDLRSDITININYSKDFKPIYAITVHKAQGMTADKPYSIYEYNRMRKDMLYVCLTRARKKEYVNFCDINLLKPYTGYIYRYTYNGKCYIGSTNNIKDRKEEHKQNNTNKFGRAIQTIGYNNLKFEILETVHYGERQELYDIEDEYIRVADSIRNGWNTRRNYVDVM